MALALKRKPLEVTVLSVLVTLRHTVPFRPLCVMWSCKVGVGYPYVFILLYRIMKVNCLFLALGKSRGGAVFCTWVCV